MADRYYSDQPIEGSSLTLGGSEAHHLLHVMRAGPGLEVTVFDGRGGEFAAEVTRCGRNEVHLEIGEHRAVECELPFSLTLAVCLPKGDRQRWLIEKAVELGGTRFVPLAAERSTAKSESATKLTRYIIEASKQCGRNRLMELADGLSFAELLQAETSRYRFIAHPGGGELSALNILPSEAVCLAVGPEGGFTDQEVAAAKTAGWQAVGLGPRILRIETAALALVARLTALNTS